MEKEDLFRLKIALQECENPCDKNDKKEFLFSLDTTRHDVKQASSSNWKKGGRPKNFYSSFILGSK